MTPRSGLTLLELIIALFLFATIVPLFAGIWSMHHRAVRKNVGVLAGNHICHLVLEQAVAAGYDGVDAMGGTSEADRTISLTTSTVDSSTGTPQSQETSKDYLWSLEIKTPAEDTTLMAGEKLVEVRVEWNEAGKTARVEMSTLLVESP